MATQSDTTGDDVNSKGTPSTEAATDCIRLDGDVRKPVPVPATSGAPYVSSGDSDSVTTAQRDAMFNKKLAFPLNLTRMLESVESKGYSHVSHWSQSGNSFVICDADLLLRDVLPKFFKTNENSKIRSFYRKLNRWGFSMSRKSAYSPNNIWRHPEFNRSTAMRYLNQALETGQVTDFLYTGSTLRGQKRRAENSVDCENSSEDLYPIQNVAVDCPSVLHSRTQTGPTPTLATHLLNRLPRKSSLSKKSGKRSQSDSSIIHHQQKNRLRGTQSTETFYRGSANASFELIPSSRSNAQFDLTTPLHQERPLSSCAPSATVFNLNAQEILATHGAAFSNSLSVPASSQSCNSTPTLTAQEMMAAHATTSSSNIPTPITSQENASSLFTASVPKLSVTNFALNVMAAYATASSSTLPTPFTSQDNTPTSFAASMPRSPFTNFALNTQEMMAAHATTSSSKLPTPVTHQNNGSPSFAASMPRPPITNFTLNDQKRIAAHATKRSSDLPTLITSPLFAASVPTRPITNFALSAQDMMAAHATKNSSDLLTPITSQIGVSSSFAAGLPIPKLEQPLQSSSAMTEEEEGELMDFLGTFAETLLPSIEGEEGGGSLEVDPMPISIM